MAKVTLSPDLWIYPMPALLIGASVDSKPDFMTLPGVRELLTARSAYVSSVGLQPHRHTLKGIRQNQVFSVHGLSVWLGKRDRITAGYYSGAQNGIRLRTASSMFFNGKRGK